MLEIVHLQFGLSHGQMQESNFFLNNILIYWNIQLAFYILIRFQSRMPA